MLCKYKHPTVVLCYISLKPALESRVYSISEFHSFNFPSFYVMLYKSLYSCSLQIIIFHYLLYFPVSLSLPFIYQFPIGYSCTTTHNKASKNLEISLKTPSKPNFVRRNCLIRESMRVVQKVMSPPMSLCWLMKSEAGGTAAEIKPFQQYPVIFCCQTDGSSGAV